MGLKKEIQRSVTWTVEQYLSSRVGESVCTCVDSNGTGESAAFNLLSPVLICQPAAGVYPAAIPKAASRGSLVSSYPLNLLLPLKGLWPGQWLCWRYRCRWRPARRTLGLQTLAPHTFQTTLSQSSNSQTTHPTWKRPHFNAEILFSLFLWGFVL